jgi:hypothetical protein
VRNVAEWTIKDLEALIGEEESQRLEFKRSAKLLGGKWKSELAKSVSAMANAVGGVLVIGLAEDENNRSVAGAIDEGLRLDQVSPDQLGQALNAGILPHLTGLVVRPIDIGKGTFAYAIEVPGDGPHAPYQVQEQHRYFQRQGREAKPLLDFQIRDIMARRTKPALEVRFSFGETHDPALWLVQAHLWNTSDEPALYYAYDLFHDVGIKGLSAAEGPTFVFVDRQGKEYVCSRRYAQCAVPAEPPCYRERPVKLLEAMVRLEDGELYALGYYVACPGCRKTGVGYVRRRGNVAKATMGDGTLRIPAFEDGVTIQGDRVY